VPSLLDQVQPSYPLKSRTNSSFSPLSSSFFSPPSSSSFHRPLLSSKNHNGGSSISAVPEAGGSQSGTADHSLTYLPRQAQSLAPVHQTPPSPLQRGLVPAPQALSVIIQHENGPPPDAGIRCSTSCSRRMNGRSRCVYQRLGLAQVHVA
jgi:hypothetical protein